MTTRKKTALLLFLCVSLLASACGVKGPPLPPLGKQDIPVRPSPTPKASP